MSDDLVLAVKRKWFDRIKSGSKREEFRLRTEYWRKRLEGRSYRRVVITLGYPRSDDLSRRLSFSWDGVRKTTVKSAEWDGDRKPVYAISLRKPIQ